MVLVAPKIILAIVSPFLSLTSIRIGFGLELSIAEPVVSEVLKWNPITVQRNIDRPRFCFYRIKKFIGALAIAKERHVILLLSKNGKAKRKGNNRRRMYTCVYACEMLPAEDKNRETEKS